MMYKMIAVLLITILTFTHFAAIDTYASQTVNVMIDGEVQHFEVPAVIHLGRTMLPLRSISEALGFTVEYDEATQTATLRRDAAVITHQITTNVLNVNGEDRTFDVPSIIQDARTLVPVRMITEAAGAEITWIHETNTAAITTRPDMRVAEGERPAVQHFVFLGGVTEDNELIVDMFLRNTNRHHPISLSPIYEADPEMPARNIPISPNAEIRVMFIPPSFELNPDDVIRGWPVDLTVLRNVLARHLAEREAWFSQTTEFSTYGTFEIRIEDGQVTFIQEQYHP